MKKLVMELENVTCPSCAKKIQDALRETSGVDEVSVLLNTSRVRVNYNENLVRKNKIAEIVTKLGYPVLNIKE